MLYTASYFQPENHHGEPIGISLRPPKSFQGRSLLFLAPSAALLSNWKQGRLTEEGYVNIYRAELYLKWRTEVKPWLQQLDPAIDQTLLCWERAGEFCHRNSVAEMIRKWRPDCYGGRDVPARAQLCLI